MSREFRRSEDREQPTPDLGSVALLDREALSTRESGVDPEAVTLHRPAKRTRNPFAPWVRALQSLSADR